jgi:hypothetical protein
MSSSHASPPRTPTPRRRQMRLLIRLLNSLNEASNAPSKPSNVSSLDERYSKHLIIPCFFCFLLILGSPLFIVLGRDTTLAPRPPSSCRHRTHPLRAPQRRQTLLLEVILRRITTPPPVLHVVVAHSSRVKTPPTLHGRRRLRCLG